MRGQGFDSADIATSLYLDPKVRRLPHDQRLRLVGRYLELVLASWRDGHRLTLDEACDLDRDQLAADQGLLAGVGLVDDQGRIPPGTWTGWYGLAQRRREAGRERVAAYRARKAKADAIGP